MKCQSCGCEVPPAFVHAIKMNQCAGCGGPIMDEASVELMNGLAAAMEKMEHDPQGIAGWLLSNYRLEKVGDGEPTGFHKVRSQASSSVYSADKQDQLNKFFKNASAPMDLVGKKKKDLKKKYQQEVEDDDDEDESEYNEPNDESNIDPDLADVNTSDVLDEKTIEAIERKAAAAAARKPKRKVEEEAPEPLMPEEYADLDDTNPILRAHKQKLLEQIVRAREEVTSGGKPMPGSFSRG